MDKDLEEIGEALGAALESRSGVGPPAGLRDRTMRAVGGRGHPAAARWWARRAIVVGGSALAVLLVASLAWGLSLNAALAQERSLRSQLSEAAAKDEIVFDIVDARNVSKTTLRSTTDDSPTAAYGKVFTRPDMPYVVAMVGRLPPAPDGREYHLYLDARLIGKLVPNDGGFAYLVVRGESVGISYQQARVLVEPVQASDASGAVVLSGSR